MGLGGAQRGGASPRKKANIRLDDKEEFAVAAWGRGDEFQLGNGERRGRPSPIIMLFTKAKITSIACGSMHTLVVMGPSHAPRVLAWGEGQHGQLGLPKSASMHAMHPVEVKALAPTTKVMVREVGAGGNSSFALNSCQELLLWGDNSSEQLGLGASFRGVDKIFSPKPLSPTWDTSEMQWRMLNIHKAVLSRKFGLAIDKYGRAFSWGENSHGQLGVGDRNPRNTPVLVENVHHVRHLAAGLQHCAAIDSRKHLWTWGDCGDGRLGHGVLHSEVRLVKGDTITRTRKRVEQLSEPKCVEFFRLGGKEINHVACGDRFTVALDNRGVAWSWGSGIYGQLGIGSNTLSSDLPVRVSLVHSVDTNSLSRQDMKMELARDMRGESLFAHAFSLSACVDKTTMLLLCARSHGIIAQQCDFDLPNAQ
jgi:alpha-tubulin suppressor-like RCC1 family protein